MPEMPPRYKDLLFPSTINQSLTQFSDTTSSVDTDTSSTQDSSLYSQSSPSAPSSGCSDGECNGFVAASSSSFRNPLVYKPMSTVYFYADKAKSRSMTSISYDNLFLAKGTTTELANTLKAMRIAEKRCTHYDLSPKELDSVMAMGREKLERDFLVVMGDYAGRIVKCIQKAAREPLPADSVPDNVGKLSTLLKSKQDKDEIYTCIRRVNKYVRIRGLELDYEMVKVATDIYRIRNKTFHSEVGAGASSRGRPRKDTNRTEYFISTRKSQEVDTFRTRRLSSKWKLQQDTIHGDIEKLDNILEQALLMPVRKRVELLDTCGLLVLRKIMWFYLFSAEWLKERSVGKKTRRRASIP